MSDLPLLTGRRVDLPDELGSLALVKSTSMLAGGGPPLALI